MIVDIDKLKDTIKSGGIMLYVLTMIVTCLNMLNVFIRKKRKFISVSLFLLLVILMGTNTNNPDYFVYKDYFNLTRSINDFGFMFLIRLFNSLNISYEHFRLILAFIGLLLINITVKKSTNNNSLFYLLYFIYPFFIDVVQIRNFIAYAIVLYAITYLIEGTKNGKTKFAALVLIASSIHLTSVIYLVFLFIEKIKKPNFLRLFYYLLIFIIMLVTIHRPLFINMMDQLFSFVANFDNRIMYYNVISTRYGYLFYWFIQFGFIGIIVFLRNTLKSQESNVFMYNLDFKRDVAYIDLVFWLNMLTLIFLPAYAIHSLYFRFYRNLVPLNYLGIIPSLKYLKPMSNKKIMIICGLLILSLSLFYIDIFRPFFETIIQKVFQNSWFLK